MNIAKTPILLLLISICAMSTDASNPQKSDRPILTDLRTEYRINPLGLETLSPRLSWKIMGSERNLLQESYHIQCAQSAKELKKGSNLLWDSGEVLSEQSVHVEYNGEPLSSGQKV